MAQPAGGGTTPGGGEEPGVAPVAGAPGTAFFALQPVVDIDREQRGHVIRGTISGAGPAATTTIEVSARRRDLAAKGRRAAGSVRLRRVTRTMSAAGRATFAIPLGPGARSAVLRRKRVAVTVRVAVSGSRIAAGGVTRTRRVTLLAPGVPVSAPPRATVEVRNDFFAPRVVTIRRGGVITWTWVSDGRSHNVVQSGARSPDQTTGSYRRTFRKAGSFPYACSLHDGMIATVNVR